MKKKIPLTIYYYISFVFMEFLFRLCCTENVFNVTIINLLIYLIPFSLLMALLSKMFNEKVNGVISKILSFGMCLWYAVNFVFKRKFGVFFSINSVGLANQLKSFFKDTLTTVGHNIIYILLLFVPFILLFIFRKRINYNRINKRNLVGYIICILISSLMFYGSLFINRKDSNSLYNLFYKQDNHQLLVEKIGVLPSTFVEIRKNIFVSNEDISDSLIQPDNENINHENSNSHDITYNTLDIDFDKITKTANNKTITNMNKYFKNDIGTNKNIYTGMYKGKNLILFMAESFNSIGVSKELTPTLYKMFNESFVFENYYSPVILSTIGGEFQELTGLYPNLGLLSNVWRKGVNQFPFGIGNVFNNLNYETHAYHNNAYNFQGRNKYLKAIGFNNYLGCYNGLEERINCKQWPQSDDDMIKATVGDYVNSKKPFMTYYVTVSGHMDYNWGNSMSRKHKDKVINLPYSDKVKAYLATQIELDHALETLVNELKKAGKLDDTVIALVGDHYPYALNIDEINEVSTYKRDSIIEINRSNFMIWNNKTKTVHVKKVGSQIDVIPTLYNLFGVKYDSRLFMGKDILSNEDGVAIFSNNSWVSDLGRYYSTSNKFVPKDGVEIPDNYVSKMNNYVRNKIIMSRLIMETNYYKYIKK